MVDREAEIALSDDVLLLVDRCLAGDQVAMLAFVEHFQGQVLAFATGCCNTGRTLKTWHRRVLSERCEAWITGTAPANSCRG